jgi:hypothetical protein
VSCAALAHDSRCGDAGFASRRMRGLFIRIPRTPPNLHRRAAQRPASRLGATSARDPKQRRTPRNSEAFGACRVYQTDPPCQAAGPRSSRRKPSNPRRSRRIDRCATPAPPHAAPRRAIRSPLQRRRAHSREAQAASRAGASGATSRCDVARELPQF